MGAIGVGVAMPYSGTASENGPSLERTPPLEGTVALPRFRPANPIVTNAWIMEFKCLVRRLHAWTLEECI